MIKYTSYCDMCHWTRMLNPLKPTGYYMYHML
jgi:hypothetical protein